MKYFLALVMCLIGFSVHAETKIGDVVLVEYACKTQAIVEHQIDLARDEGKEAVAKQSIKDFEAGLCIFIDPGIVMEINKLGKEREPIRIGGKTLMIQAIGVGNAWSPMIEELPEA